MGKSTAVHCRSKDSAPRFPTCPLAEGTLVSGVLFVDKSASPAQAFVLAQTAAKDDGFFAASAN